MRYDKRLKEELRELVAGEVREALRDLVKPGQRGGQGDGGVDVHLHPPGLPLIQLPTAQQAGPSPGGQPWPAPQGQGQGMPGQGQAVQGQTQGQGWGGQQPAWAAVLTGQAGPGPAELAALFQQARMELAQELEANLQKLKQVISEGQQIARKMELILEQQERQGGGGQGQQGGGGRGQQGR